MIIKHVPEDFRVEEQIQFPGGSGGQAYYRIEKRGLTTLEVREALASRLKVPVQSVVFPALKDARAIAVQYASVSTRGPERVQGRGFTAQRISWGPRSLQPGDLLGNRFLLMVRDLEREQAWRLAAESRRIGETGLPNYFDTQRFGSSSRAGFIGKALLLRDAETALRLYLTEPMAGDPAPVRSFKATARELWPDWGALFEAAPRPSNFRSLLTFLKDHPTDYRKAINLIPARLLSIYLSAYQSWLWNCILAQVILAEDRTVGQVEIAGEHWPIPDEASSLLSALWLALPQAHATYPLAVQPAVLAVLEGEGLVLDALKARILQKAYLTRGERPAGVVPEDVKVGEPEPDTFFVGRWALELDLTLPPGSYATLVLKVLGARARVAVEDRL